MIKIGQVYRCRFKKQWAMPDDVDFFVLVTRIQITQVGLTIINDKNDDCRWVGSLADYPVDVGHYEDISDSEEAELFSMLEYELCPTYQVNFKSPQ